ncbi:hypothetical protein CAL7102_09330 [Dulcicalothrix desertica PCC 7102]|nr:hypothetical protein CAL7102_09330 [Dulcicalothrix desertica PCC 7102]
MEDGEKVFPCYLIMFITLVNFKNAGGKNENYLRARSQCFENRV